MKGEFPFVTKKQAVKLKELGFDWSVTSCYSKTSEQVGYNLPRNFNTDERGYSAPTVAHALRWLREKKKIFVKAFPMGKGTWMFNITFLTKWKGSTSDNMLWDDDAKPFKRYDKAESRGLDYALDYLLKQKKLKI